MRQPSTRPPDPRAGSTTRRAFEAISDVNQRVHTATAAGTIDRVSKVRQADGDVSVRINDHVIRVMDLAGARSVNLPSATRARNRRYRIEDGCGLAGTHTITVRCSGSQTISGSATKTITSNYGSITVRSDGSNWIQE